jgi:HK97 gp10 family phage protein
MGASLKSRLPEIAAELRPKAGAAVKAGAELIAADARARVHVRSGELQNRIHVERRAGAEYSVVAGDEEAFYGHILEGGSDIAPPYPFLTPAFEENQDEVVKLVQASLKTL